MLLYNHLNDAQTMWACVYCQGCFVYCPFQTLSLSVCFIWFYSNHHLASKTLTLELVVSNFFPIWMKCMCYLSHFLFLKKEKQQQQNLWCENYMRKCDYNHQMLTHFFSNSFHCFSYAKQTECNLYNYSLSLSIDAIKIPTVNEHKTVLYCSRHTNMRIECYESLTKICCARTTFIQYTEWQFEFLRRTININV